jgi:hypothetical protein
MGERRAPVGLADLQATLYDLITAPEGAATRWAELGRRPAELESIVKPNGRLSALERVEVYADMYFYRIRDVLRDEYKRVVSLVGDEEFHNLVTDYLIACPPSHHSLREAGARLPAFLAQHPLAERHPAAPDLAGLERLHLDLYDGPDTEVLTLDEVRSLPPERIPTLYLQAIPGHAIVRSRFTLSASWRALGIGEASDLIGPIPETLLVWRQGLEVNHRPVDADEEPLLPTVGAGARLEQLCERLIENLPEEGAPERAFQIVGRWLADGLIAAPTQPVGPPARRSGG